MAAFRLRKPGGGSALRGGDGFRGSDAVIYEYVGAGGAVAGGSATVALERGQEELGHGVGYLVTSTPSVPIRRRQYGHAAALEYVGTGGMEGGGTAEVEFQNGKAQRRDEDEFLLLMAA